MRKKAAFIVLIFILSLGLTLAWLLGAQASPGVAASPTAELHVCPSGCPYDNVQDAVDAAIDGDIIKVAEGTYTGVSAREGITQMVYISKSITIQGGYTTSDWDTPRTGGQHHHAGCPGAGARAVYQGASYFKHRRTAYHRW